MVLNTRIMIARFGLAAWLLVLVKFILFKHQAYVYDIYFSKEYPIYSLQAGWQKANMIPFRNIAEIIRHNEDYQFWLGNISGNIAGFMPLGFLYPLSRRKPCRLAGTLVFIGLVSVSFELLQWMLGTGIMDIDDLILNLTGGMAGWVIFRLVKRVWPSL